MTLVSLELMRYRSVKYISDHNNVITRQEILTVVRSIFDMVGPNASESLGDDTPEERVERVFGLMARVSYN